MPSVSPRSNRAIADSSYTRDEPAHMLRTADGHRSPPRYPDGIEFDLCDCDGTAPQKHVSEIRDYREDFG